MMENADTLCRDCIHMQQDEKHRFRCYSPQLIKMDLAGILCVFERDSHAETDRSHKMGTGKCGPSRLNYRKRED